MAACLFVNVSAGFLSWPSRALAVPLLLVMVPALWPGLIVSLYSGCQGYRDAKLHRLWRSWLFMRKKFNCAAISFESSASAGNVRSNGLAVLERFSVSFVRGLVRSLDVLPVLLNPDPKIQINLPHRKNRKIVLLW